MHRSNHLALTAATCLALAACGDDLDPAAVDTSPDPAAQVEVTGTDELVWRPPDVEVAAGPVDVRIDCGNQLGHEFAIEGVQDEEPIAVCDAAGTGAGEVELEAGEYTFFCAVPGHRDQGMEGDLTVTPDA